MKVSDLIDFESLTYKWSVIDGIPFFAELKKIQNAYDELKNACNFIIEFCKTTKSDTELLLSSILFWNIWKTKTQLTTTDGRTHTFPRSILSEKLARLTLWEEDCERREDICSFVYKISNYETIEHLETMLIHCLELFHKEKDAQYIEKNTNIPTAYIIIGIPGAGKSTYSKTLSEETNAIILNREVIRAELGFCGLEEKKMLDLSTERKVTEEFNKRLIESITKGKNIILDDINLTRIHRNKYKELLSKKQLNWVYVYVEADSVEKNIQRRKEQLSEEEIERFRNTLEWPNHSEKMCDFKIIIT